MAEAKKTAKATVKKPVAKAAAETTKKAAEATAKKAAAKTTAAKTAATKTTETKTTAAKTTAAKKTTTKTAAAKTTKKAAAVKENISIQFAGKDYTTEQLVKIAKDVWEFDLKKDPADFKEVQLYVKPEEAKVYYVINGTETGSFDI